MQVVGQGAVSYGWDNANRLTTLNQGSASVGLGYDTADPRTTLTLPNGVTVCGLPYLYDYNPVQEYFAGSATKHRSKRHGQRLLSP